MRNISLNFLNLPPKVIPYTPKTRHIKSQNPSRYASALNNRIHWLGEAPVGKPHAGAVREEDIELVDAQFDKDGNVCVGLQEEDERTQDEKEGVKQDDSDEDEPQSKKKMKFTKASN